MTSWVEDKPISSHRGGAPADAGNAAASAERAPSRKKSGPARRPSADRFDEGYVVDLVTRCWLWLKQRLPNGYGRFHRDPTGAAMLAHRFSYERFIGPIPKGLTVDHLCRVRHCVNPEHLEAVTQRENTLRGESPSAVNAAKTICKWGHPLNGGNTYIRPDGNRDCRSCHRRREAERTRKEFEGRLRNWSASPVAAQQRHEDAYAFEEWRDAR